MKSHYEFSINAREYGKQNLSAVIAFLFLFFVMEGAFINTWRAHQPISFWTINSVFLLGMIFFAVVGIRNMRVKGDYQFVITDELITAKSPHPMMGESFNIALNRITKLQILYQKESGVRDPPSKLFRIYHHDGIALLQEYPGHTGAQVFAVIRHLRPDLECEERPPTLAELLKYSKRSFRALKA